MIRMNMALYRVLTEQLKIDDKTAEEAASVDETDSKFEKLDGKINLMQWTIGFLIVLNFMILGKVW